MNELKPEDVMKALECCTGDDADCNNCPYWVDVDVNCFDNVKSDALALLREKDARIKELEETQGAEFTCFVGEPHKVDHCPYGDELVKKDAEIERLKKDREELIVTLKMNDAPFPEGLQIVHDFCEKRKMEVITEFAERLKSEVNGGQFASYKGLEIRNVIDQIAKEMKEGKR